MRRGNSILLISTVAILLMPFHLFAQRDTIAGYYRDSLGKIFVAPDTHVQLYMGITPESSKSVLLKSFPTGNSIIHWNGHGPKHLSHYNMYLGRNIRFDLYVDGFAPKTNIELIGSDAIDKEDIIYISSNAIIELTAVDKDAGLKAICYAINNQQYKEYIKPIELKEAGKYTISVYAIDNVGNTEDEVTKKFYLDNTPPVTEIIFEGDNFNEVLSGKSKISFKSSDNLGVNKTIWKIDDGLETEFTKPIPTSPLTEGDHTIYWYSLDLVNNLEETKTFNFFVDKTPPMVFEEIIGNTYMVAGKEYSSGRSQLKVAAVDNKAGIREIYFSLNNNNYQLYEKPVYLSDILGSLSVKSYAVDNVNNKSISSTESQVFSMPEIDITGPNIAYSFEGSKLIHRDTMRIGPKTLVQIKANDQGAGVNRIIVKPKGALEFNYVEPFSISTQGYHEITSTAYDNVENINLINFAFSVDSEAPKIYYHFSTLPINSELKDGQKINIYTSSTILFLAATDNLSGIYNIEYSINDSSFSKYEKAIGSFKPNSSYIIKIKTTDILGNESLEEISFRIE